MLLKVDIECWIVDESHLECGGNETIENVVSDNEVGYLHFIRVTSDSHTK